MSEGTTSVSLNTDHLGRKRLYDEQYSSGELNSQLLSGATAEILQKIEGLKIQSSSGIATTTSSNETHKPSTDELLFDARADVKILTSKVSMHLPSEFRRNLFNQVDLIHDPEDWDPDDAPANKGSFASFLRWYLISLPDRGPGLGLSSAGNIIAAWVSNKNKLILEFLPSDKVKWIVTRFVGGESERASGQTSIQRLFEVLQPYNPKDFFQKKD